MKKFHTIISRYSVVFTLFCTVFFTTSAYSQDTCKYALKNAVEVGGNFSIKSSSYFEKDTYPPTGTTQTVNYLPEYDLTFAPSITWFPANGLGLDFGLSFTTQNGRNSSGNYSFFQSSFVVGVGYYFNIDSTFFPFIELLGARNISGDDQSYLFNHSTSGEYGARAGCKIAATCSVLVNLSAQIMYSPEIRNDLTINAGFSFIL
ncbi:MAG TPA: hypothetical protein VFA55_03715 [Candidatus Kapabacteria bacterium]|nr:hypothetical protein [Candidatus Kapabacteria bacterium]